MENMDFIKDIAAIGSNIKELEARRDDIVASNTTTILKAVFKKMDWTAEDVVCSRVSYSCFERRIMIEVVVKYDRGARYVFALGKTGEISLKFREDYSMH